MIDQASEGTIKYPLPLISNLLTGWFHCSPCTRFKARSSARSPKCTPRVAEVLEIKLDSSG